MTIENITMQVPIVGLFLTVSSLIILYWLYRSVNEIEKLTSELHLVKVDRDWYKTEYYKLKDLQDKWRLLHITIEDHAKRITTNKKTDTAPKKTRSRASTKTKEAKS